MSITTIALLPLMAYILNLRLKSVYLILKKNNEDEKKKSEILYLALSVILIVFLFILSELIMP